eukprot:scaffold18396_cov64-Cylindrotheca_fusiformis.AAC.1
MSPAFYQSCHSSRRIGSLSGQALWLLTRRRRWRRSNGQLDEIIVLIIVPETVSEPIGCTFSIERR